MASNTSCKYNNRSQSPRRPIFVSGSDRDYFTYKIKSNQPSDMENQLTPSNTLKGQINRTPKKAQELMSGLAIALTQLLQKKIYYPECLMISINSRWFGVVAIIQSNIQSQVGQSFIKMVETTKNVQVCIDTLLKKMTEKHQLMKNINYCTYHHLEQEFNKQKNNLEDAIKRILSNNNRQIFPSNQLNQVERQIGQFVKRQNVRLYLYSLSLVIKNLSTKRKILIEGLTEVLLSNERDSKKVINKVEQLFKNETDPPTYRSEGSIPDQQEIIPLKQQMSEQPPIYRSFQSSDISLSHSSKIKMYKIQSTRQSRIASDNQNYKMESSIIRQFFSRKEKEVDKQDEKSYNQIQSHNMKMHRKLYLINYLGKILKNPFENVCKYKDIVMETDSQGEIKKFQYSMEKGEADFSQKFASSIRQRGVKDVFDKGKLNTINFLISATQSIIQLEKVKIFHADFKIGNFIKFGNIFQINDFDYALMCAPEKGSYFEQLNKQIIQNWLQGKDIFLQQIFKHLSAFEDTKRSFVNKAISLEEAAKQYESQLQKLMIQGHRKQLISVFEQIFSEKMLQVYSNIFSSNQVNTLRRKMIKLIQDPLKPQYQAFCHFLSEFLQQSKEGNEGLHQSRQFDANNKENKKKELLYGKRAKSLTDYQIGQDRQQLRLFLEKNIVLHKELSMLDLDYIRRPYFDQKFIEKKDGQTVDFKVVYRDDCYQITRKEDIFEQGEEFLLETIYRLILIVKELNKHNLYHPNLTLNTLVRKSNTVYLEKMHDVLPMTPNPDKNQRSSVKKVQINDQMKFIIDSSGLQYYRQSGSIGFQIGENCRRLNKVKREMQEHHHMTQFKDIVKELLTQSNDNIKINKRAIMNILDSMIVSTGYDQLQNQIVRQLQHKLSKNTIYKQKEKGNLLNN